MTAIIQGNYEKMENNIISSAKRGHRELFDKKVFIKKMETDSSNGIFHTSIKHLEHVQCSNLPTETPPDRVREINERGTAMILEYKQFMMTGRLTVYKVQLESTITKLAIATSHETIKLQFKQFEKVFADDVIERSVISIQLIIQQYADELVQPRQKATTTAAAAAAATMDGIQMDTSVHELVDWVKELRLEVEQLKQKNVKGSGKQNEQRGRERKQTSPARKASPSTRSSRSVSSTKGKPSSHGNYLGKNFNPNYLGNKKESRPSTPIKGPESRPTSPKRGQDFVDQAETTNIKSKKTSRASTPKRGVQKK